MHLKMREPNDFWLLILLENSRNPYRAKILAWPISLDSGQVYEVFQFNKKRYKIAKVKVRVGLLFLTEQA